MTGQKVEVLSIENRRRFLKDLESNRNAAIQEMNDTKTVTAYIKNTKQSISITIDEAGIILSCRAQQVTLYDGEARALLEELKILYGEK